MSRRDRILIETMGIRTKSIEEGYIPTLVDIQLVFYKNMVNDFLSGVEGYRLQDLNQHEILICLDLMAFKMVEIVKDSYPTMVKINEKHERYARMMLHLVNLGKSEEYKPKPDVEPCGMSFSEMMSNLTKGMD